MSKKKTWFLIIAALVLIVILSIAWVYSDDNKVEVLEDDNTNNTALEEKDNQDPYRSEVATNTVVPEKDDVVEDEKVAVPKAVSQAAPNVEKKFRSFDVVASGGNFSPSEIIVNEGDTVHVDFIAEDGEYDITFPSYGMKQTASAGETKILEFQAVQSGKFLYYCESCGGEDSLATGNIVVVAKE